MSGLFDSLSEQDVRTFDSLVDTLNRSSFDFLELRTGQTHLLIGKGTPPSSSHTAAPQAVGAAPASTVSQTASEPAAEVVSPEAGSRAAVAAPAEVAQDETFEPGTVTVTAPTIGRFYSRPEPTAEPFVTAGMVVTADATIGLVEVMKLFNAVEAGVAGTISKIHVEDGAFVEHGQVLMTIRPSSDQTQDQSV